MWGFGLDLLGHLAKSVIGGVVGKAFEGDLPAPPEIEEPKMEFQDPRRNKKMLSGTGGYQATPSGGWGSAGGFTPDHQFGQTSILTDAAKKRVLGRN
tara:strand:+ start:4222 stop:4512 length:291 start_codon:yes stop_codon:yes gene_type:complete